jgi:energy-coupling factor transporter ATP-binding protein EcfA2
MIARRVSDPYREMDALILILGRKGSGKSTLSIYLAQWISYHLSKLLGGKPTDYFTIKNVRSVDPSGTMEMLTSDLMTMENQILILDDASISWNSRDFAKQESKGLNAVLTICRVYKIVLIVNTPAGFMLDKVPRTMADYIIHIIGANTYTKQTLFKCFFYEVGETGKEYRKYLTWHGKRIKYWISYLPSLRLLNKYKKLRKERTDIHIKNTYDQFVTAKLEAGIKKQKKSMDDVVEENWREVSDMRVNQNLSFREIGRRKKLTHSQIDKCMARYYT